MATASQKQREEDLVEELGLGYALHFYTGYIRERGSLVKVSSNLRGQWISLRYAVKVLSKAAHRVLGAARKCLGDYVWLDNVAVLSVWGKSKDLGQTLARGSKKSHNRWTEVLVRSRIF